MHDEDGKVEEFNWQFQDNVDRGVFQRLTAGEARAYGGAVNYISMVETLQHRPTCDYSLKDLHEPQHEAATTLRSKPK
jgi:hypothetical protein